MAGMYSDAVRLRCRDPRRAGSWPDGTRDVGTGDRGSLESGAWAQMQVHVAGATGLIDDARFRVFGCSAAVASASYVADAVVGVVAGAGGLPDADAVAEALALPADKRAMAALATEAVQAAVADWEVRNPEQRLAARG